MIITGMITVVKVEDFIDENHDENFYDMTTKIKRKHPCCSTLSPTKVKEDVTQCPYCQMKFTAEYGMKSHRSTCIKNLVRYIKI